jgi:hypothetical protein
MRQRRRNELQVLEETIKSHYNEDVEQERRPTAFSSRLNSNNTAGIGVLYKFSSWILLISVEEERSHVSFFCSPKEHLHPGW